MTYAVKCHINYTLFYSTPHIVLLNPVRKKNSPVHLLPKLHRCTLSLSFFPVIRIRNWSLVANIHIRICFFLYIQRISRVSSISWLEGWRSPLASLLLRNEELVPRSSRKKRDLGSFMAYINRRYALSIPLPFSLFFIRKALSCSPLVYRVIRNWNWKFKGK